MKRFWLSMLPLLASALLGAPAEPEFAPESESRDRVQEDRSGVRFTAYEVHLDPQGEPLAAYQVRIRFEPKEQVKIVGIEGGEHEAFRTPPYYDAKALQRHEVILAGLSTLAKERLPKASTRVATLHLQIIGSEPTLAGKVGPAANSDGARMTPTLKLIPADKPKNADEN